MPATLLDDPILTRFAAEVRAAYGDIANVIAFLCSDGASFVSGQVIYVAGGPRG